MDTCQYVCIAGEGVGGEQAGCRLNGSVKDIPATTTAIAGDQPGTKPGVGSTMVADCRKDEKVVLNIGGTRFMTYRSTLQSLPGTRLALLTSRHQPGTAQYPEHSHQDIHQGQHSYSRQHSQYSRQPSVYSRQQSDNRRQSMYNRQHSEYDRQPEYDASTNEYFYDRSPALFSHILEAYRQGELHVPRCVCAPVLRRELQYWGVEESLLAPLCCLGTCAEYEESCRTLQEVDEAFCGPAPPPGARTDPGAGGTWRQRLDAWRIRTWIFLEDPNSSRAAKIWALLFVLLLLTSVMVVCLDSLPDFRVPADSKASVPSSDQPYNMSTGGDQSASSIDPSYNLSNPLVYKNPKLVMYLSTVQHPAMFYINHGASVFFGAELLLRFLVCPYKRSFLKSFFNVIDVLAVLPTTAASVVSLVDTRLWLQHDLTINYIVFTFTSIFRAIRIVKLMKHYRGLRVMFLALKASSPEMLLLTLLLSIAVIIFSTTIYFAELHHPDTFPSIPMGFWWSVVTMTTVGYGDSIPQTAGGYVVGALCAVSGMLITGLPIPIMANNFRLYYTSAKLHAKLEAREAKLQAGDTQLQANSPKLHAKLRAKLEARGAKLQTKQIELHKALPSSDKLSGKLKAWRIKIQGQDTREHSWQSSSQGSQVDLSGHQCELQDKQGTLQERQNGLQGRLNGAQNPDIGTQGQTNSLYREQNGTERDLCKTQNLGAGSGGTQSQRLPDSGVNLEIIHNGLPHQHIQLDL